MARLLLFFFLFGQNGLHHIAGLGDVREIDFGSDRLLAAPAPTALVRRRPVAALNMHAHLFGFIGLERA
jgi:hypothetical protein